MLTNVVVGLVVLFAVILLAVVLGSRARRRQVIIVDSRQETRNLNCMRQLAGNGAWNKPILHKGK